MAFLQSLALPADFHTWFLTYAGGAVNELQSVQGQDIKAIDTAIAQAERELGTTTKLRIRELLDDEEFQAERGSIQQRLLRLRESLAEVRKSKDWFEPCQILVSFSSRAAEAFQVVADSFKRMIVEIVGSNPTLMNKILSIEAAEPFSKLRRSTENITMWAFVDEVRTLHQRQDSDFLERLAKIRIVLTEMDCIATAKGRCRKSTNRRKTA